MRRLLLCALCVLWLALPASAGAADVRMFVPSEPPPEDAAVTFAVSGSRSSTDGETRAVAEVRPLSALPCGSTPAGDPGTSALLEHVATSFSRTAEFVPPAPGLYLACAWLVDAADRVIAGPSADTIQVRPPRLSLFIDVPPRVVPGSTVSVRIDYTSEVRRVLAVALASGSDCDASPSGLVRVSPSLGGIADLADVIGTGNFRGSAPAGAWGQYVVCGFLFDPDDEAGTPSQLVGSARVQAGGPRRRCVAVGGRRRIEQVRVGGVSCRRGRSVARRWGDARRPPKRISGLECRLRSGRGVICAGYQGEVTFRYRR